MIRNTLRPLVISGASGFSCIRSILLADVSHRGFTALPSGSFSVLFTRLSHTYFVSTVRFLSTYCNHRRWRLICCLGLVFAFVLTPITWTKLLADVTFYTHSGARSTDSRSFQGCLSHLLLRCSKVGQLYASTFFQYMPIKTYPLYLPLFLQHIGLRPLPPSPCSNLLFPSVLASGLLLLDRHLPFFRVCDLDSPPHRQLGSRMLRVSGEGTTGDCMKIECLDMCGGSHVTLIITYIVARMKCCETHWPPVL